MLDIKIVLPSGAFGASVDDDALDTALRVIGVAFGSRDEWAAKYGTDLENDVFMMHRYCWCDLETCGWCSGDNPNFLFKPTGFTVHWYKYIGRGVKASGNLPSDFMQQIFATHPKGMTVDGAISAYEREQEEVAESLRAIFGRRP